MHPSDMRQIVTPASAMAIERILALALLAYHVGAQEHPPQASLVILAVATFWTAITGGAHMLRRPASLRWVRVICAGDALFAILLATTGMSFAPIMIIILIALYWLEFGGKPIMLLPVIIAPALTIISFFILRHLNGIPLVATNADLFMQLIMFALTAAATANFIWIDTRLKQLNDGFDFGELMSISLPFAFDLDVWLGRLATILGGERECFCAIALADAEGLGKIHSNRRDKVPQETDIATLLRLSSRLPTALTPATMLTGQNGDGGEGMALLNAIRMFTVQMHAAGDRDTVLVRALAIGRMRGVMLVSHPLRLDSALGRLTASIDRSLDLLMKKLWNTLEARRQFLSEAREISRRDLHDGVLQTLAALRMRLSTTARNAAAIDDTLAQDLRRTSEIVSLEQARLRALLDTGLERNQPVNLIDSLKISLRTISLQWEIEATMATEEMAIPTDKEAAENIEHLVREVVANASRHSESRKVNLGLAMRENTLILTLRDYGGENCAKMELNSQSNPLSSRSLKQRLALVNGEAYWENVSQGTLLAINIPMIEDIRTE